ncbi:uncharacterized protein LOC119277022 isoform X3 [Triticum dicoccoides]|uniref:uncharacterized protein LOC119277022 isoform X3 n=1 Tax=Triticum dicoccoides TaxID=85692 RepID=UPI00188FFCCB|nr:uncharacterized protein LOC119277022 isoform X3 [Triticum dicoccoides]
MARGEQPLIRCARRLGVVFQINLSATDRRELASASSSSLAVTASLPTYNNKVSLLLLYVVVIKKVGVALLMDGIPFVLAIDHAANAKSRIGDLAEREPIVRDSPGCGAWSAVCVASGCSALKWRGSAVVDHGFSRSWELCQDRDAKVKCISSYAISNSRSCCQSGSCLQALLLSRVT